MNREDFRAGIAASIGCEPHAVLIVDVPASGFIKRQTLVSLPGCPVHFTTHEEDPFTEESMRRLITEYTRIVDGP